MGEEFDLSRVLIEARTAAGLSQSQLARRMKTSQSYVARIEGGKVRPSTDALECFAQATRTVSSAGRLRYASEIPAPLPDLVPADSGRLGAEPLFKPCVRMSHTALKLVFKSSHYTPGYRSRVAGTMLLSQLLTNTEEISMITR
jgi:transcriptional regulator with XRE-family HTH domain